MRSTSRSVRPIAKHELPLLQARSPRPLRLHRDRWALQQAGKALYLISWQRKVLAGHVLLEWPNTSDLVIAPRVAACPNLSDFWVAAPLRSQGIGTSMLATVARIVQQRGYRQIGLAVATDNVRARVLYEREGFCDSGLGTFTLHRTQIDADGRALLQEEQCVYLTKRL
jgi:GNAT superfamily N-acetyltransferase